MDFTKIALLVLGSLLIAVSAGSGRALATSLCEAAKSGGCRAAFPVETPLHGAATAAMGELEADAGGGPLLKCSSELSIETQGSAEAGESLLIAVNDLRFFHCGKTCSLIANELPYASSLTWTEGTKDGQFDVSKPDLTLTCAFGFHKCHYAATTYYLTFYGGTPAAIDVVAVGSGLVRSEGIVACGPKFDWDAKFAMTSAKAAFVTD